MGLGKKLVLLVIGTLAAPVLAAALVALLVIVGTPNGLGPSENFRTVLALHDLVQKPVEPQQAADVLRSASPDNLFLIMDQDKKVLATTLPAPLADMIVDPHWQTSALTRVPLHAPDGTRYFLVVAFHVTREPAPWLRKLAVFIALAVLAGLVLLMSIIIIRSINRSIVKLEVSTRRIAAGDLDFRLEARGRDKIASLTRSFDEMRRRVKESAEARSRFIMSVSHDLKTPLSSIMGYVDAIEDGLARDSEQLKKYLAIVRDKAGLLETRISQLIDYVKLETGEWTRSREQTNLASFLRESATVFASEAEIRGFPLELSLDVPPSTTVSMDADLVSRALENLVHNAFRYAEPGTTLKLTASMEESCVMILVTNRGSIDARDLPFIFEPFYRGSKSRREAGFGLGLAVVKWVVSSHGWTLDVKSEDGETTFAIGIPLTLSAG